MKNTIGIAIIVLALNTSCSQKTKESNVSKVILESFKANFKETQVETWDKEKGGGYEAEFDYNGIETSATFNSEGKLMETEQEIEKSSLPKEVADYVLKNYPGKEIQEVAKITNSEGKIMYEVEIDKNDLMFDNTGNFIK